jgi:hypothetical protein
MLLSYLYYIRDALRERGERHVSTDVTPGIRMIYSSYCFTAEDYIMTFQLLTLLRTGKDDTKSPGM